VNLIPGPLALAFALQDLAGFLWTVAASRADVRVPSTVDALAGTVSGDLGQPTIRATELIYVASMLEQAKMFEPWTAWSSSSSRDGWPSAEGWRRERIGTYAKAKALACRSVSAAPSIDGCWEWTPTATTRRIATSTTCGSASSRAVASFARGGGGRR